MKSATLVRLVGLFTLIAAAPAFGAVPSDVPTRHWARAAVEETLKNGLLKAVNGKFMGDSAVTRTQAVIEIAALARLLEAGKWHPAASKPVADKLISKSVPPNWERVPVTRYTEAMALARIGDFVANGLPRPPKDANDLGKSVAIPRVSKLSVSPHHPAYAALRYLVQKRMIQPGSPLLQPDGGRLRADELSLGLGQMAIGLTDVLTPLGHDSQGATLDVNSPHKH